MPGRQPPLRVRFVVSERRNDPFALALLGAVVLGLLVVVFAPRGTFVTGPGPGMGMGMSPGPGMGMGPGSAWTLP